MNYKFFLALLLLLLIAGLVVYFARPRPADGYLKGFAQCLADKGITMYGASWCPHCQNEKKAFGDAFRYVPYVECPDNPNVCLNKGVEAYPTWIFPDGRKLVG